MLQTMTFLSLEMKNKVTDVSFILFYFLPGPVAVSASFDENTWNSKRRSIILGATCGGCGTDHIFYADMPCHM